jgi:succinate dehydrogenase / fumarate reductase membrane anchor subunit
MGDAVKSGRLAWYLQRWSALYFILFLGYLEYVFWTNGITFEFLSTNNLFKVSLSIFIFLACAHAFIGLWTVGTDYLTKRTLGFISMGLGASADSLRKVYEFIFILLGALIATLYVSIIWF